MRGFVVVLGAFAWPLVRRKPKCRSKPSPGYKSPVTAFEMGKYIAGFAITGHRFFNGKVLPVAVTTP